MEIETEIAVAVKMLKGLLRESDRLGMDEIMRIRRVINVLEGI